MSVRPDRRARVVARPPVIDVVLAETADRVVARAGVDRVDPCRADDDVVARRARDRRPVPMMVALSPLHLASSHSSVNVPVEPPLPSTAILYVVPATALNAACVAPLPTDVSAPRLVPV